MQLAGCLDGTCKFFDFHGMCETKDWSKRVQ